VRMRVRRLVRETSPHRTKTLLSSMPASAYERFRAELADHLAWSGYTVALAYGDHTREILRD
jgi:hypothetical protein